MLDGPFDENSFEVIQALRNNRRSITSLSTSASAVQKSRSDIDQVMCCFVEASELFDVARLPRQRIRW